jgi:glycosyltransferase involved in cell wall biosynthesis
VRVEILHICVITPEFDFGGIGYYVSSLTRNLRKKGIQLTIITRAPHLASSVIKRGDLTIYQAATPPLHPFHVWVHGAFVNNAFSTIAADVDIVHCHSPVVPLINTQLPTITTIHSLYRAFISFKMQYFPHETLKDPHSFAELMQIALLSKLEKQTFQRSQTLTSVSKANIHYLNQYDLTARHGIVIGNGVDTTFFKPAPRHTPDRNMIFVGRLTWEKGITRLLDCAETVLPEYPDVKVLFAGEGPLRDYIEQRVRKAKLQKRILCLGRLPRHQLLQLYQQAYLQIIPSIYEGLPNVLLEAMATETPVIATAVGGIPEVISSGHNGLLMSQQQVSKLPDCVRQLLDDPSYRNRLGLEARKTIEQQFTWDTVSQRLCQCYTALLSA